MNSFNFDFKDVPKREELLKYYEKNNALNLDAIHACLVLFKTTEELSKIVENQFQEYGVSDGKFSVLMTLYKKENHQLAPSEIGCRIKVTRATITGLLDGLEKDEFIERCKHPSDKRMLTVKMTEKGFKLMEELAPKHFALLSTLLDSMDHDTLKAFTEHLNNIRSGIK